jgi:hypothetical protein
MTKRAISHIRKEQFVRRVRYIGELTIYFRDKDAILITDGKNMLLCERWFEGRGFYSRSWRPFAENLTRNNSLETLSDVLRLATKHEITTHAPRYEQFEITRDTVVLPSQYKEQRRK